MLRSQFVLSDTNSGARELSNSYRRVYANHQTLSTVQEFLIVYLRENSCTQISVCGNSVEEST